MTHVLLGEWGFLDNLNDTSGHGHSASVNFSPTYIDGPVTGTRAIRFSATGQRIDYGRTGLEPVAADGGIVTMAWVKVFSSHTNYTQIIHKTRAFDSTRHSIDVGNNDAFLMARWRDQLVFRESGNQFADFGWHHICNVDSEARYAWFVDGALLQSGSRSGESPVNWEDFTWGSGYDANMSATDSSDKIALTGIRILSGTLSDAEVVTYMNTPVVPPGRSGKPKVWNGSAWVKHTAKVWNGSAWVPASMAAHNGTDWVVAK